MPALHVLSVVSDPAPAAWLVSSAAASGLPLTLLTVPVWTGYVDKLLALRAAIASIPDDDVVCFVDAYDVLAYAGADELLAKFLARKCEMVISAELNMYPASFAERYAALYAATGSPAHNYLYVNSGGYIGYRRALEAMLAWKTEDEMRAICAEGGDQTYVTDYFLTMAQDSAVSLQLDGAQLIFQTMCKVDMTSLQFVAGRMRNRVMDSEPCFAHFNSFNAYSMQTKNLDTGVCSDVRDVFCELREQSLVSDAGVVAVRYDVPYYMVYGGKILVNLPQVAGDDAGYKG